MQSITQVEEFGLIKDNQIIGMPMKMNRCVFEFFGKDNIIYFDEKANLDDTSVRLYGNNNVVFISANKSNTTKLKIDIYNNSVFYIGKECNTTRPLHIVLSECKHIFIGDECLFSLDIWMRNADPHLIYDTVDKKRINPSKSIYIGDHVWVGQNVLISKGTKIGSGSIVGAKSLTSSTLIPSNCSVGGVPAKIIRENIFWRKPSVHGYTLDLTKASENYQENTYIYKKSAKKMEYETIDRMLDSLESSQERYQYLYENIYLNNSKNRFFIEKDISFSKRVSTFLKRKVYKKKAK